MHGCIEWRYEGRRGGRRLNGHNPLHRTGDSVPLTFMHPSAELSRLDQEVIGEAFAAFCAGIDEVGHLHDALRFPARLFGLGDEINCAGLR